MISAHRQRSTRQPQRRVERVFEARGDQPLIGEFGEFVARLHAGGLEPAGTPR